MTDRLLVDLDADGHVSVSTWRDGEFPSPAGPPRDLVWPLGDDALEDLRWYLEDYLRMPFGVYEERGPKIADRLTEWGEAAFDAVFGPGSPARDAYVSVRTRAAADVELVFRSPSAERLALPWELLRDPARPSPLALDGIGLSRSLPAAALGEVFPVGGERLRVLMVISRPSGTRDVGYRMIARPLLERLEVVRGVVDLVVLRPPTLDELGTALTDARTRGQPFQVVHFDGHGVFGARRGGPGSGAPHLYDGSGQGMLVFEKPGGGADEVPAATVAQVLAAAEVPLVVLNACQSGAVGKDLEAAVAARLLQEGAAAVVAMAYSVYAVAAAEFMAAFYERLFAGDTVTRAVAAGRRQLARRDERPSPRGPMPLADWVVPVLYARREVRFPHLRTGPREEPGSRPSLDAELDRLRAARTGDRDDPLAPVGEFVGRDALFYTLEAAARLQRVVVLHGPGGTGKTELAKAFGRWWRDTGGVDRPDWVVWHSFEPGVASFGIDGVLSAVGLTVFGTEFARVAPDERREVVHRLLAERRLLLVWDNFESVHTMPDPTQATPPLDEAGRNELKEFLARVAAAGRSSVIVTSRTEETWLGDLRRVRVGGLTADEAIEYADALLAAYPAAAPRRARRAFGELMEWLDGHPLSMRLVLPHLDSTGPDMLLSGLRGTTELPGFDDGGRTTSLAASVSYSYDHLAPDMRRLLVAVSLFHGVADANVLGLFSAATGVPDRFRGLTREDWGRVLNQAAGVGLLSSLGGGLYRIHPALPAYLAAHWRAEDPAGHDQQAAAAQEALLDAGATLGNWLLEQITSGDASTAFTVIDWQRRTLGGLLGYALDQGRWEQAACLAQPLDEYWDVRGLHDEARGWVDRARLALEGPDGRPPAVDDVAGALWLFLVSSHANRQALRHELDAADATYREILGMLDAQPESDEQQERLSVAFHQLGRVARLRGRLDEAEDRYRQSLTISERRGDRSGMAYTYLELGRVAELRGRLDAAEDWYRKGLAIHERRGNRPGTAGGYHQLGNIARRRGRLDEAEDWYRRRLTISEQLGDRSGIASTCHELGTVAYLRDRLAEAEDWYRRSVTISEYLADRARMAPTFGQLGLLAEQRGRPAESLEWTVRCVTMFDEFPHPATGPGPQHLARLTAELGVDALQQCWRQVTGGPVPREVLDFVQSNAQGTPEAR